MCLSVKFRYEETGDVFDKHRSGRPRKTTAREDCLLARKSKASPFSTAAELHETWSPEVPMSTRTVCRILSRNGLHGRISAQKPALNKRQLKNRAAFAKAHSLPKGWTLEKWQKVDFSDESSVELHHSRRKYSGDLLEPAWIRDSPRKQFGGGKIIVWGYIQYGGVREVCSVEGNINNLKYQEVLAALKGGKFCSRMVLHCIPPSLHQRRRSRPAQSPDMNIIEHVWGRMKEEA